MFAKTIIDSDAFLDMPLSTQALYFHLNMRADDDGFVNNPKKIQRMIMASDDDMRILIGKNFIIPFESGVVVIKHWKIHNYIRCDRYKETVYKEEMSLLKVKDNNAYTLGIPSDNQTSTTGIPDGYQMDTQVRVGKDSIGKDNRKMPAWKERFDEFWKVYPKKQGKGAAEKSWEKIKPTEDLFLTIMDSLKKNVEENPNWKTDNGRFIPNPSTWLNQKRWEDATEWVVTKKQSQNYPQREYSDDEYLAFERKKLGIGG